MKLNKKQLKELEKVLTETYMEGKRRGRKEILSELDKLDTWDLKKDIINN